LRKAFILTLGCPKNEADSDSFAGCLKQAGWEITAELNNADLLLINTCAFIKPAVDESLEVIDQAIEWKSDKPGRKLILAGCLPGRYPIDDSEGLEGFDLITGPGDISGLAEYLSILPGPSLAAAENKMTRYLKISEGCSNNCSYCTIPVIRGTRFDRDPVDILKDAGHLVDQGAVEIGIVGQDTASWKSSRGGISWLLSQLAAAHPRVWFRLYYIHPAHYPADFHELLSEYGNIMPYIDIPIQHVSSRILRRMGRPYSAENLRDIFDGFERSENLLSVRVTLITGYPGETESDFTQLLEFLSGYSCIRTIVAFPYWPEEGTREYSRSSEDEVPDESAVQSRLMRIGEAAEEHNIIWAERLEGRVMDVLADTSLMGHTRLDAPSVDGVCCFDRSVEPGSIVSCRITGSTGADLTAEVIQ